MYELNAASAAFVDQARKIAEESIAPNAVRVDGDAAFPDASIRALAEQGFLGLTVPEVYGGKGQGLRTACAVLEEIAQRCGSTAMVYMMHLAGIAAYSAAANPPEAQLRAAAAGEHLSTLAWSEFGSRSHFWAPVSREVAVNGHVVLDAAKSFVTAAGHADGYVVSVGWSEAKTPTDNTLYLVLKEDAGVRVSGTWDGLGLRGNASAPIRFTQVSVDRTRALSEPGKGLDAMLSAVLPFFALGNSAVALGIAEAAVQATQKHITTGRFQYLDSMLSDLPVERARLAQMRIDVDAARSHIARIIESTESPSEATMLMVLESKVVASETAMRVTETALRACGGTGFSKRLGVERNFRDARAAAVMAPTNDALLEFIGRALCGMEVFG